MKPNNDIRKELEEISPFLAKLKDKKEGFEVPKDYFSTLADDIMEKCLPVEGIKKVPPSKNRFWDWLDNLLTPLMQPRYAMALSSLVFVVFFAIYLWPSVQDNAEIVAGQDVTREEVLTYVTDNLEDFDLELLAELDVEIDYNDLFELNEQELEEYINENVLDQMTLEELL